MATIENIDPLKLYQATVMVLSSYPPMPVDAIFLHARSFGDETSLIDLAAKMYGQSVAKFIAINGAEGGKLDQQPKDPWPGTLEYARWLRMHGVEESRIVRSAPAYNTKEENQAFLRLSIARNWTSTVILTQPHQLLRAMLGMIRTMEDADYCMAVYSTAPPFTSWLEQAYFNRDLILRPRFDNIQSELERVPSYQKQGHLASVDQLITYMMMREKRELKFGQSARGSLRFFPDCKDKNRMLVLKQ